MMPNEAKERKRMDNSKIHEALMAVQSELKAPKGQMNKFGGYKYRSCEDILEAVKPILKAHSLVLRLSDKPVIVARKHGHAFICQANLRIFCWLISFIFLPIFIKVRNGRQRHPVSYIMRLSAFVPPFLKIFFIAYNFYIVFVFAKPDNVWV